ncbi:MULTISPECIES: glycosyltransferase family 4 protein [Aneurinibacillus]|uniref:Glycosyltransferase involved in cell wall bisynthesis n=1 Tax=Aneurinibacillus thermoaerophilus TaxID=143495 RepID=Q6T1X1_ANETH|nr:MULTISPECIES: glycosyltransferase [Aneurinibacillus]AAS55717.1 putative hexosyltransferase [Aneurinibacillus thermoaerophilus]AMA71698.1 hexosyltransferase [Aneurinibacillus sp. XH2]MED0738692.1 glycosyltransferase [Aneurinibacillus thermoaerophilus]MED0757805.1 glycosyltransferase [Aneurinibacillus thermoaerophilus]MED0761510.1 glycosyltransferase [Aneurinibacillus thermoaerophilus]
MKRRIAFVVQRYGLEVNGGSEASCRMIAERLSKYYEVEVLTTKAIDYTTWADYYEHDIEEINGVFVRRFSTNQIRNMDRFGSITYEILNNDKRTVYEELEWMRQQGPVSFEMIEYIKKYSNQYDVFIFFTYLYFTTFHGIQLVPEKSIFVPTAHDEPYIYFSIFRPIFHLPRYNIFLTVEEQEFVHKLFRNSYLPFDVAGVGVDVPQKILSQQQFKEQFKIVDPYVIYVGRIDESKGCKELFDYFMRYKEETRNDLKLVLMGKSVIHIPKCEDIIPLGFVSEEEKFSGIAGAKFLIMPSKYESLSMVVLESLSLNRPVLVNEECEVLKGHCERGNAGLYYKSYEEFKTCVNLLLQHEHLCNKLGKNGKGYVDKYYRWSTIIDKFIRAIESIVV